MFTVRSITTDDDPRGSGVLSSQLWRRISRGVFGFLVGKHSLTFPLDFIRLMTRCATNHHSQSEQSNKEQQRILNVRRGELRPLDSLIFLSKGVQAASSGPLRRFVDRRGVEVMRLTKGISTEIGPRYGT